MENNPAPVQPVVQAPAPTPTQTPDQPVTQGEPQKTGRFKRGWLLMKSSWRVFKLDKELTIMPVLSIIATVVALAAFAGIAYAIGGKEYFTDEETTLGALEWPLYIAIYLTLTFIGNFFAGAVIHAAITRFRGGDPTVGGSIAAVRRKFAPVLFYSVMMSTVGIILDYVAERVPLGGRIVTWLVGAAWNVANFFSLPIIVMSDKTVMPLTATKRSIATIRQVWGESLVANVSIAIISFATTLLYVLVASIFGVGLAAAGALNTVTAIIYFALAFLGLVAMMLVFSVLSGIVKAAVYHYATTGEAPENFNRELLRTAMTPKKARKVFSH